MTEAQRDAFCARFAKSYDLPAACRAAGVTHAAAYRFMREGGAAEIDRLVQARLGDRALAAIREEYERLAFGGEEVRAADRIRALEQLRLIHSSGRRDGGAPALTIRCEYV